jgi:tetratricopeptide (TPR) repeat protein
MSPPKEKRRKKEKPPIQAEPEMQFSTEVLTATSHMTFDFPPLIPEGLPQNPGAPLQRATRRLNLAAAKEEAAQARAAFVAAKRSANECWRERKFDECLAHLDECAKHDEGSDVVQRYRARCHSQMGRCEDALAAAGRAVELNPMCAANFQRHAQALCVTRLEHGEPLCRISASC